MGFGVNTLGILKVRGCCGFSAEGALEKMETSWKSALRVMVSDGGSRGVVRIPVSSPYIEVRMDTSGLYTLVKACTDTSGIYTPTRHTGHTHTLHLTYTIDKHSLRPRPTHTIYRPELHVKSTRPSYACNLRLILAHTYNTS